LKTFDTSHFRFECRRILPRFCALLFLIPAFGLTSCASIEGRCLTPSGALTIPTELPPPKDPNVLPGGLTIRIDSPLLQEDPGFNQAFVARLRQMGGGRFQSVRGTGKKPQYVIRITEMTKEKGFKGGEIEAVIGGALAGGLAGSAVGGRRSTAVGAGLGAAAAYYAFGEKKDVWAFEINLEILTSESGRSRLRTGTDNRNVNRSGNRDQDTSLTTTNRKNSFNSIDTAFDVTSHTYRLSSKIVCLGKGSGLFSKLDDRKKAARTAFLNRVPAWLFGGQDVGF